MAQVTTPLTSAGIGYWWLGIGYWVLGVRYWVLVVGYEEFRNC